MESIGYMLVYFIRGSLPWQGIAGKTKAEKYSKIAQSKANISPEVLCKGLPTEFVGYINYCKKLKFEETPDYDYLRKLFNDLFAKSGFVHDSKMDWNMIDIGSINNPYLSKNEAQYIHKLLDPKSVGKKDEPGKAENKDKSDAKSKNSSIMVNVPEEKAYRKSKCAPCGNKKCTIF